MFRTPCAHHQENHLYMQLCMVCFSYLYASRVAGGRMCSILIFGLLVHVTQLTCNTRYRNIKLLIYFVTLYAGCTDYAERFSTQ